MANDARAEAVIAASPEAVFPWLVEPERIARWIGGTVECRADRGRRACTRWSSRPGGASRSTPR